MATTQWQLQEAKRLLAPPDLLTDGLLGRFYFNRVNQIAFSEDLGRTPWVRSGVSGQRTQDPTTNSYIELLDSPSIPGESTAQWVRYGQAAGTLYQDVAVLPSQIYTYTFYLQPLTDVDKAQFAVTAVPSGNYIVQPISYDSAPVQRDAAGYIRLGCSFRVPAGVTTVRIHTLLPADLIQISVDALSATYQTTRAGSLERGATTIRFRGTDYTLATSRLRSENE